MQAPCPAAALVSCCGHARALCVSRCVGRSAVTVPFSLASPSCADSSFDQLKEAAPSLLKARLSFIHDTGFLNTTISNDQNTMLASIEKGIDKLEHVLTHSEEEIHENELFPDAEWEAQSKIATLQEEIHRLQTLLELKENSLKVSLHEATLLRTHLQDAEAQAGSLRLFKEAYDAKQADNLSRLERLSLESLEIIDKHLNVNEAMSTSFQKKEASLYFQALLISSEELAKAEAEVSSLHQKVINTEGLLEKERKSLSAARVGLEELDRSLGNEESKVDDLFKEVTSLKVQLEHKETTVQSLTKEALKNKGLQEMAKKHLAVLLICRYQIEHNIQIPSFYVY